MLQISLIFNRIEIASIPNINLYGLMLSANTCLNGAIRIHYISITYILCRYKDFVLGIRSSLLYEPVSLWVEKTMHFSHTPCGMYGVCSFSEWILPKVWNLHVFLICKLSDISMWKCHMSKLHGLVPWVYIGNISIMFFIL